MQTATAGGQTPQAAVTPSPLDLGLLANFAGGAYAKHQSANGGSLQRLPSSLSPQNALQQNLGATMNLMVQDSIKAMLQMQSGKLQTIVTEQQAAIEELRERVQTEY